MEIVSRTFNTLVKLSEVGKVCNFGKTAKIQNWIQKIMYSKSLSSKSILPENFNMFILISTLSQAIDLF